MTLPSVGVSMVDDPAAPSSVGALHILVIEVAKVSAPTASMTIRMTGNLLLMFKDRYPGRDDHV